MGGEWLLSALTTAGSSWFNKVPKWFIRQFRRALSAPV